ncbi:hypothetical protein Bra3105_13505 [Brachybacterium halotolerans subsp. kimchii]|uniref:hypothetical protein n=1 Tax=Brachybacterium halotolerans TaxID=2795215 RepID=UPI001E48E0A8|nr:hypothetical protein [Brachybacterium halotolerans]UEJ84605.1 hypothetical protein Bra3105_13505 [Brachybacterium halotolerans subsp. kimchii]
MAQLTGTSLEVVVADAEQDAWKHAGAGVQECDRRIEGWVMVMIKVRGGDDS